MFLFISSLSLSIYIYIYSNFHIGCFAKHAKKRIIKMFIYTDVYIESHANTQHLKSQTITHPRHSVTFFVFQDFPHIDTFLKLNVQTTRIVIFDLMVQIVSSQKIHPIKFLLRVRIYQKKYYRSVDESILGIWRGLCEIGFVV